MLERLHRADQVDGSMRSLAEAKQEDSFDPSALGVEVADLRDDLIACEECDAFYERAELEGATTDDGVLVPFGHHYECKRCGAALGLVRHPSLDLPLALALAGLAALAIAHTNNVLVINIQGQVRSATLWGAAWTLYDDGAWFMSILVLLTTLVNPLVELGAVVYVLLPLRSRQRAPGCSTVLRAMQTVRPWVMVEVFMLGVLVAFVKLNGLASVIPGAGLWGFGAVMILAAAMASAFDYEQVWASASKHLARR